MKTDTYRLTITFLQPILGSQPTANVASVFIAGQHGMTLPEDEIETLPDALERGTTVFHKDPEGRPLLWDYQVKGFLKADALVLNGKVTGGVKNLRSKVNNLVFLSPRTIPIAPPNGSDIRDEIDYLERPLRAQTAQGDRVALALGELWCRNCGQDTPSCGMGHGNYDSDRTCLHCGSTNLIQAVDVLRPGEYA